MEASMKMKRELPSKDLFKRDIIALWGKQFIQIYEDQQRLCTQSVINLPFVTWKGKSFLELKDYVKLLWLELDYVIRSVNFADGYVCIQLLYASSKCFKHLIDNKVEFTVNAANNYQEDTGEFEQVVVINIKVE